MTGRDRQTQGQGMEREKNTERERDGDRETGIKRDAERAICTFRKSTRALILKQQS